jgi:hypothetical protein
MPRLQDEFDLQEFACQVTGLYADDPTDEGHESGWGADPFDIVAQIEEEQISLYT